MRGKLTFFSMFACSRNIVSTPEKHLDEIAPGEKPGAEKEAIGEGVLNVGQPGLHDSGEDHGVDEDLGQRIQDRPGATERRAEVAPSEVPRHHPEHEATIRPEGGEPAGKLHRYRPRSWSDSSGARRAQHPLAVQPATVLRSSRRTSELTIAAPVTTAPAHGRGEMLPRGRGALALESPALGSWLARDVGGRNSSDHKGSGITAVRAGATIGPEVTAGSPSGISRRGVGRASRGRTWAAAGFRDVSLSEQRPQHLVRARATPASPGAHRIPRLGSARSLASACHARHVARRQALDRNCGPTTVGR